MTSASPTSLNRSRSARSSEQLQYLMNLSISVFLALLIGGLIMLATGHDPLQGYASLLSGAFGSKRAIGNMIYKSAQLCLTGLATAIASSAGIFNVGGEGQMYLGAIASAYLGSALTGCSPWISFPLCFLAAILAGAFYAWIPAILKIRLKINEVITTILMNSIAIFFCSWLANGPLKTTERGVNAGTSKIDPALLFKRLIPGSSLYETIFFIAAISLLVWFIMSRTSLGYEMRMTGQNARFARFSGLKAEKLGILGMLISGAMCGLLGLFECFSLQTRFKTDFSNEFYFDGMLVAMIMRYKPLGIILMSFFFGILKIGAVTMQNKTGISNELILIVQSLIIFFMAAEEGFVRNLRARRASRKPANAVTKEAGK